MSLEGSATPLRCPSCGSRLVEVERADVLVDACPECRGVWLERGELDKILVRERRLREDVDDDDDFLREVEGPRRPPERGYERGYERPDERRYGDDAYKRRKRRSLLEDLLDF